MVTSSIVIHEVAAGKKVGYGPAQVKLNDLARQGYRIVSVFPEKAKYVIIAQRDGGPIDPDQTIAFSPDVAVPVVELRQR